MGLTKVTTKLISLQHPTASYEAIFLVDTGATDSMAPADELDKIGVIREGKMSYELADGTVKEYPYGLVRIEFMGEITAGRVIFGTPECEPLLGVTALESVGIVSGTGQQDAQAITRDPLEIAGTGQTIRCTPRHIAVTVSLRVINPHFSGNERPVSRTASAIAPLPIAPPHLAR